MSDGITDMYKDSKNHPPTKIPEKVSDPVNSPSHYNSGNIECIEAIKEAVKHLEGFEGYCIGNALKYLWRWKLKNGTEDLKKAIWYINRVIKEKE